MTDYAAFDEAVGLVRKAGLIPTHTRLLTARLMLESGPRASLEDLAWRAAEDGLPLSRDALARALTQLSRDRTEGRA